MKITFDVFRDGNQVGVCLGKNLAEGFSGFGETLGAALKDLARDLTDPPEIQESQQRRQLRRAIERATAKGEHKANVVDFPAGPIPPEDTVI